MSCSDFSKQQPRHERLCRTCAKQLGVYEPLVHVAAGVPRITSIAAEPCLEELAGYLFHQGCYDSGNDGLMGAQ